MMRPQRNRHREFIDLGGLWRLIADPEDRGRDAGWADGFAAVDGTCWIGVPGSIQEQLEVAGWMGYQGPLWLETECAVPQGWTGRRMALYLPSAEFHAEVYANGVLVGTHDQPFLPQEFDLHTLAQPGATLRLVVRLDGRLRATDPLMGIETEDYTRERRPKDEVYPPVRGDFYPYLGLHRGALLTARPVGGLDSLAVATDWSREGTGRLDLTLASPAASRAEVRVLDPGGTRVATRTLDLIEGHGSAEINLLQCQPWRVGAGTLYTLALELFDAQDRLFDSFDLDVGFRSLRWNAEGLLLNHEPLRLRGVGMHEDFPVLGKGQALPVTVRDFGLLGWLGANCLRTSHYPYAEETLDLADRLGVLVISEAACVNLDFRKVSAQSQDTHRQAVARLIARDASHPSVIMWSLANEPGYLGEAEYRQQSGAYWESLCATVRELDPTRPVMVANVEFAGRDDPAFEHCDVVAINRYWGWYTMPGQLERARARLREELDYLGHRYRKPILVSEFGADAVAGAHALSPQLFTEEYQAALIEAYLDEIEGHPACMGALVWNFADFRTAQHHRRVVHNLKGLFTRERQPKTAAFALRRRWIGD
jgi:beta-glucuronidase